ncbi:MAG: hypothetical protein IPF82_14860 [Blastocatellia bacterium]|nr:hypothetical protein [Blastocatellia bacterium]
MRGGLRHRHQPERRRGVDRGRHRVRTSTAIGGEITIRAGRVEQSRFLDYPVIRMGPMPKVEIHIVPSTVSLTGMGELRRCRPWRLR